MCGLADSQTDKQERVIRAWKTGSCLAEKLSELTPCAVGKYGAGLQQYGKNTIAHDRQ